MTSETRTVSAEPRPTSSGLGRVLVAVYAILALAALGRSSYQIATKLDEAPLAYGLSALAALVYVLATVALVALSVLRPESAPTPLLSVEQKTEALAGLGVDLVVVLDFTPEFAALSPEQFVDRVLVGGLGAEQVLVGADFRYGAGGAGTVDSLRSVGNNPTFGDVPEKTVEAHAIDVDLDLYGSTVELEFVEYIRPMHKFASAEELATQMGLDELRIRQVLGLSSGQG